MTDIEQELLLPGCRDEIVKHEEGYEDPIILLLKGRAAKIVIFQYKLPLHNMLTQFRIGQTQHVVRDIHAHNTAPLFEQSTQYSPGATTNFQNVVLGSAQGLVQWQVSVEIPHIQIVVSGKFLVGFLTVHRFPVSDGSRA